MSVPALNTARERRGTWVVTPTLGHLAGNRTFSGKPIRVWDSHKKKWRQVYPIFLFAFADTPARRMWALTTGHTGNRGCDKCGLRGLRLLPDGFKLGWSAWAGFCSPCEAMILNKDKKADNDPVGSFVTPVGIWNPK